MCCLCLTLVLTSYGILNKSLSLAEASGVTKFTTIITFNMAKICCVLLMSDLNIQQIDLLRYVEQKLELSCNFRFDQIHNNRRVQSGRTLMSH
jgi:hypothetical protein